MRAGIDIRIILMIKKGYMDEEKIAINEAELDLVRDIFKTLTKTIKTFNVYPKGNPIYEKFAAELFEKFTLFFESAEELTVDVQQDSLLYRENEVFHSEERGENIALFLFADGLRQLNFHKDISRDEVTDFIEILRAALKSKTSDDDDIVTLLWEKNIRNMGYVAVDDTIDDDLAVEETLLQAERDTGEDDFEAAVEGVSSDRLPEAGYPGGAPEEPLSASEIAAVHTEISDVGEHCLAWAADLFLELLSSTRDTEAFPVIITSIGKILDLEIGRKNVTAAIALLRGLKEISPLYDEPSYREILREAFAIGGSLEHLTTVFESSSAEEIRKYLHFLGSDSIPNLIQLLGELEDRRQRRLLCEIMAEKAQDNIDTFGEALEDSRWYLVRNLAMILGMTKEPSAVKHLEKTLGHHDTRVRRETVRALDAIRGGDTKRLFLSVLDDSDLTVRVISLKALRRFNDPELFEALKKIASREDLKKKTFAEKKELLETLAVLGGENAFPLLSDLFKKGWLLEKDDVSEMRAAAAYGLGLIGNAEAAALLEKETTSRKSVVREACIKALKEREQSGNAGK
jgi:HEAT repeat protein